MEKYISNSGLEFNILLRRGKHCIANLLKLDTLGQQTLTM